MSFTVDSGAPRASITIEQGATFRLVIDLFDSDDAPLDLGGFQARMAVRERHASAAPVVAGSTADGRLVISGNSIAIEIPDTVTMALPAPFTGVWDLELVYPSAQVDRLLQGVARISPEVSR